MSKRKRSTSGSTPAGPDPETPASPPEEPAETEEAGSVEEMAHVSKDLLAGSPDIFSDKPAAPEGDEAPEPPGQDAGDVASEAAPDPVNLESPADVVTPAVSTEASSLPLAVATPYTPPRAAPAPAKVRSSSSSVAFGVVLVVLGLFALGVVVFGVDLTQYGWPLFVIIPGLTLLVVGFFGVGAGASIPGGLLTTLGLVLAYQGATGDWASWAFAWALVTPGGVGLGMYLQALRDRDAAGLRRGRNLIFIAVIIFMIGFVFFESILGISGVDYGLFGKAALPLLLIAGGVILLVRNSQRSHKI